MDSRRRGSKALVADAEAALVDEKPLSQPCYAGRAETNFTELARRRSTRAYEIQSRFRGGSGANQRPSVMIESRESVGQQAAQIRLVPSREHGDLKLLLATLLKS